MVRRKILTILVCFLAAGFSAIGREKSLPESGAAWIGAPWFDERGGDVTLPAPLFRKDFDVPGKVRRATVSISGLGYFCLYVNGERVGDDLYVPGFTDYGERPWLATSKIPIHHTVRCRRVLYLEYDISRYLRKGQNRIDVLVGNGFYNSDVKTSKLSGYGSPRMICSVGITCRWGRRTNFVSDLSWKVRESEVRMNDVYRGETFDARFSETPWQTPVLREAPSGTLELSLCPPDRVTDRIAPLSVEKQENGLWKVDFGRTVTGRIAIEKMTGARGDSLEISYISEERQGKQIYIFKGEGEESHAPEFNWNCFSGVLVKSSGRPSLVAEEIHSDVRVNASFSCSEPMLERIEAAFRRSQLDNMHSGFASDCPHREKCAYTGDGQVAMAAALGSFDAEGFYRKWIADIYAAQDTVSGYVPNGAPYEPNCGGGPAWGSAICIMPWEFYLRYGDASILDVDAMDLWLKYFLSWRRPDGTVLMDRTKPGEEKPFYWYNLGDWCAPAKNPERNLVHTFYAWYCCGIAAKAAKVLGRADNFAENAAESLWKSFHEVFYDPVTGSYGDSGSNIFALVMGVPSDRLTAVREAVRSEYASGYLDTGIFGTRFLFETLSENGMGEIALKILTQKDFPSFGHWFAQGADTLWEQWDGVHSHNHPMFGGGLTWLYTTLAGLRTDPAAPGYRHFTVRPIPIPGLKHVRYETESRYGTVVSELKHDGSSVSLRVVVPKGCTATIHVPVSVSDASSRPYEASSWKVLEIGAGDYNL